MKGLEPLLGVAPGLVGAARADVSGNVTEIVGTCDGESLCAVAVMSRVPLEKTAEILGLGRIHDWSFAYAQGTLYVHHDEGLVSVLGAPAKNPEAVMKKIAQALGDK